MKEMTSSSVMLLPAFLTMQAVGSSPASSSGYLIYTSKYHNLAQPFIQKKRGIEKVTIHIELQTYQLYDIIRINSGTMHFYISLKQVKRKLFKRLYIYIYTWNTISKQMGSACKLRSSFPCLTISNLMANVILFINGAMQSVVAIQLPTET